MNFVCKKVEFLQLYWIHNRILHAKHCLCTYFQKDRMPQFYSNLRWKILWRKLLEYRPQIQYNLIGEEANCHHSPFSSIYTSNDFFPTLPWINRASSILFLLLLPQLYHHPFILHIWLSFSHCQSAFILQFVFDSIILSAVAFDFSSRWSHLRQFSSSLIFIYLYYAPYF